MTEQKTEGLAESLKVGEMEAEQFFNVLLQVLDRRGATGDEKLMNMTVKDFTELMIDQLRSRSLSTAQAEASTAERILTDWKGLQSVGAVTQPFRVSDAKGVDDFAASLKESISTFTKAGQRIEFVVAVAVAYPNGTYGARQ